MIFFLQRKESKSHDLKPEKTQFYPWSWPESVAISVVMGKATRNPVGPSPMNNDGVADSKDW